MAWDFETEPDFQEKLDWVRDFVREEVEPLDLLWREAADPFDPTQETTRRLRAPLQERVREQGLWACHLGPELGGLGYGQVRLALLNEILGRSAWAPSVFGCQAPDSGNAEILAHYGSEAQKQRFLAPLLAGEIVSCYAMTEPHAGADPTLFTCRAVRDGDHWVIRGEKWFASHARLASFFIVMCVTDPDAGAYRGMSMFLVPAETPGIEVVRHVGLMGEPLGEGEHGYLRWNDVRVPAENLLGGEGQAFAIAQTRLGGGRLHHAMRTIGTVSRAFDMMRERAVSRQVRGSRLGDKQAVQQMLADSWIEIEQFRLLVLRAAWEVDRRGARAARTHIAACKVATVRILRDVVYRAVHLHGALGVSNELPLARMWMMAPVLGIADGPTEVHQETIARQVLKDAEPAPGLFPSEHLPPRIQRAKERLAYALDLDVGNL